MFFVNFSVELLIVTCAISVPIAGALSNIEVRESRGNECSSIDTLTSVGTQRMVLDIVLDVIK